MSTKIAIIGDGAMATVCAKLLAQRGHAVTLWSAFEQHAREIKATGTNRRYLPGVMIPASVEITTDAATAFTGAELVVSAVPTQYVRQVWNILKPLCPAGARICSVAKGIENHTLLRPTQILLEVLTGTPDGRWPLVALSGPSIAHEVARELPTTVVAAGDLALAEEVQRLFTTSYFRVYTNPDVIGVEVAGATKNVVAIAAGILDGLAAGDNAKSGLLTRGLVEITRLGVAVGGRAETFSGLAGLGDLVTTCVSPHGRNRSLGEAIGRGRTLQEAQSTTESVIEGVSTTQSVVELAARAGIEMPITQAVHAVLFQNVRPAQAISELMSRRPRAEYM